MASGDNGDRRGNAGGIPSASFSPPSRAGVILWLKPHQLVLGGIPLALILLQVVQGGDMLSMRNIPLAVLIAVSAIDVNGRSLWQILATRLGFQLRRATGQTRWTVSPMAVDTVTSMIDLPGAAGERLRRVELVDTMFAGASYLEDLADGTVTAVLRADAANWMFAPSRAQAERAAGFREMQRVTCMLPGVRRVDTQMRCLMRPAPDDAPQGDGFAERDVRWVREHKMRAEPLYDVTIAITLDRRSIAREVKAEGGGAKGVSAVLKDRVLKCADMLAKAGINRGSVVWQDAQMLRGLMKTMSDPDAWMLLDRYGRLPDDIPVSSAYNVYDDRIQVDRTWATTMWIDRWPGEEVMAGWLAELVAGGGAGRQVILTESFRATTRGEEVRDVDNRIAEIDRMIRLNQMTGKQPDPALDKERNDLKSRRRQIGDEEAGIRFRGLVTLLAGDEASLDLSRSRAIGSASGLLHFDKMISQQWEGWLAALPLGQAGR